MKKHTAYQQMLLIVIVSVFCLCCLGCSSGSNNNVNYDTEIPNQDIAKTITSYFSAAKEKNINKVLDVLYFRDESKFEESAYKENFAAGIYPVSATVYSIDEINDNLYAITLDVEMSNEKERPNDNDVYNYVALINGEWRYILAQQNIPEEILDGADLSAYSYSDDKIISSQDVIT